MFLTENITEDFYYNLTHFSTLNKTGSRRNETECMVILNTSLKSLFALFSTPKCTKSTPLVGFDLQCPAKQ